jgi:hypothetical protein
LKVIGIMKKSGPKSLNNILVIAWIIFSVLFVKSLITVVSPNRLRPTDQAAKAATPGLLGETLPQLLEPVLVEKLKERNFFTSALVAKKNPSAQPGQPALPPLGPNEVRDQETGATFKFLGSLTFGETPFAIFMKVGAQRGEPKIFFLPKGKNLSKNIRVVDVGEKWAKAAQSGQRSDLEVFYLVYKKLETEVPPNKK